MESFFKICSDKQNLICTSIDMVRRCLTSRIKRYLKFFIMNVIFYSLFTSPIKTTHWILFLSHKFLVKLYFLLKR